MPAGLELGILAAPALPEKRTTAEDNATPERYQHLQDLHPLLMLFM